MRFPGFEGEWKVKKLGELLEFKNGINASKEQYGKGVKFINVLDILNNDFITYENIVGKVDVESNIIEKFSVQYGDVLFQRSSETREEVGTANVYLDEEKNATFGGFVIRGRKIGDYEPMFFNNLLKTDSARESITTKSGGSTRFNVGQDILSSIALYFPSLKEQEKIAGILSHLNMRITTQKKIIKNLETSIRTFREKIFSQKIRFKDNFGNYYTNWESTNLKNITQIFDGTHQTPKYQTNGIPFYSVENVTANNFTNTKFISEYVFLKENKRIKIEKGDILMTRIGDIGTARYIDWEVNASFYVSLALIKKANSYSSKYLAQYIPSTRFQKEIWNRTIHVAFPKKINLGEIGECLVRLPSMEEQTKIANFLSSIDDKIGTEKKILTQYELQKKYLLANLFA